MRKGVKVGLLLCGFAGGVFAYAAAQEPASPMTPAPQSSPSGNSPASPSPRGNVSPLPQGNVPPSPQGTVSPSPGGDVPPQLPGGTPATPSTPPVMPPAPVTPDIQPVVPGTPGTTVPGSEAPQMPAPVPGGGIAPSSGTLQGTDADSRTGQLAEARQGQEPPPSEAERDRAVRMAAGDYPYSRKYQFRDEMRSVLEAYDDRIEAVRAAARRNSAPADRKTEQRADDLKKLTGELLLRLDGVESATRDTWDGYREGVQQRMGELDRSITELEASGEMKQQGSLRWKTNGRTGSVEGAQERAVP